MEQHYHCSVNSSHHGLDGLEIRSFTFVSDNKNIVFDHMTVLTILDHQVML